MTLDFSGKTVIVTGAAHGFGRAISVAFAERGGILAYASSIHEEYVRLAEYADRVLKGVKPVDLPVQQSRSVQLVINLMAARAQGITIAQSLLLRADEVIQ